MKDCQGKCISTATLHANGRRLMVAQATTEKFQALEIHPQCKSCLDGMLLNSTDEKFEALKSRVRRLGVRVD